ncbi:MAG: hypothetical protein LBG84_08630 [Treponema sp.]|nr:hypothetical protein [Treponema sp.]
MEKARDFARQNLHKSVKMAAAQDAPGAKAIREELTTRFPRRGGKREAGEPE